ncbi:MAG TPA: DinB family protein [Terriglobia bacterium]|nr:DinB family protein [Terriglobia bacterium]
MAKKTQKRQLSKTAPRRSRKKIVKTASPGGRATAASTAQDRALRRHLVELLRGGSAHLTFDQALEGLPAELRGTKPSGVPHSIWQLLEHLRLAQWDILEFSRNPKYVALKFPDDYWPPNEAPADDAAWQASVKAFHADLKAMEDLISNPKTDLYAPIPHGEGQTILREAQLVADHNAYHLGQIVLLRRLLGVWKG